MEITTIQSSLRLDIDNALMVTSGIFRSTDVTDLPSLAVVTRMYTAVPVCKYEKRMGEGMECHTKSKYRGLGLLDRPSFETKSWIRPLNDTFSADGVSIVELVKSPGSWLTNTSNVLQFLAEGVLGVRAEVITHESPVAKQTEPPPFFPPAQQLVAMISNFGILDVLLIGLPESLNAPSTLMLVPHIVAPGTLNTSGHIVPIPISHRL